MILINHIIVKIVVSYVWNFFIRTTYICFISKINIMSFTITLSGRGGTLHTNFNPPKANYVIGLTNFKTFNAIPNIDY